jgi:hypothetical protein
VVKPPAFGRNNVGMPPVPRNPEPEDLADNLAARGSRCPIPATHDRLFEVHHWWHEIARWYQEPDPFRYALGAFVQAARGVTLMLQTEKEVFKDFGWYGEWVANAKRDPLLTWLNETRVELVHRKALEPHSWLEMRCIENPRDPFGEDDDPVRIKVSPFMCTHYYMNQGPHTDHTHEYTRHWSMAGLGPRELLEVSADIYDRLDDVVRMAHERLGASMASHRRTGSRRALPCMEDLTRFRVVRTTLKDGKEVWLDEPPGLHHHQ